MGNSAGSPLAKAVFGNNPEMVKQLLLNDSRCDVNEKDQDGATLLHLCCSEGYYQCAKILVEHGANIGATDRQFFTPLHRACQYRRVDCVLLLVQKINSKGKTEFQKRKLINAANQIGATPLHWAALWDAVDSLKILIRAGADVNAKQRNQQTPLHSAARAGSLESVILLLEAGADRKHKDSEGLTASALTEDNSVKELLDADDALFRKQKPMRAAIAARPIFQPESMSIECNLCKTPFTFTSRKYHCLHCGKIFCSNCTLENIPIKALGYNEPVKVCNNCAKLIAPKASSATGSSASTTTSARVATQQQPGRPGGHQRSVSGQQPVSRSSMEAERGRSGNEEPSRVSFDVAKLSVSGSSIPSISAQSIEHKQEATESRLAENIVKEEEMTEVDL